MSKENGSLHPTKGVESGPDMPVPVVSCRGGLIATIPVHPGRDHFVPCRRTQLRALSPDGSIGLPSPRVPRATARGLGLILSQVEGDRLARYPYPHPTGAAGQAVPLSRRAFAIV